VHIEFPPVGKVEFSPFVGIAPRRYFDLFSMKLGTGTPVQRSVDGVKVEWIPARAPVRVQLSPASYVQREKLAIQEITGATRQGRR
jgi:hypothetical protein